MNGIGVSDGANIGAPDYCPLIRGPREARIRSICVRLPRGVKQAQESSRKSTIQEQGGAKSGAVDAKLAKITDAWPTLPKAIKRAMLALIE
jgi:hypothetical protein